MPARRSAHAEAIFARLVMEVMPGWGLGAVPRHPRQCAPLAVACIVVAARLSAASVANVPCAEGIFTVRGRVLAIEPGSPRARVIEVLPEAVELGCPRKSSHQIVNGRPHGGVVSAEWRPCLSRDVHPKARFDGCDRL